MRVLAKPYRTIEAGTASIKQWWLAGDQLTPLPDRIKGWDYSTDLTVMVEVEVNASDAIREADVPEYAELCVGLIWKSTTTLMKGAGDKQPLRSTSGKALLQLNAVIPGSQVGGALELACVITLATEIPAFPGVASVPGSVLWQSTKSIHLEGTSSRFPIQVIDFASVGLPPEGYWNLSWYADEMEMPFMSNVTLRLNSARSEVIKLSSSEPDPVFFAMLNFDVARQLLRGALANSDFVRNCAKYAEGTTGSALSSLLIRITGDSNAEAAAGLLTRAPEYFDTLLQAKLSFLNESAIPSD